MNEVVYFEFNSPDPARTNEFFKSVLGWTIEPSSIGDSEYYLANSGDPDSPGINGGILASEDGVPKTINTIVVESLDAMLEAIAAHGGRVIVERFPISGIGYAAYCEDPTGLVFGIFEPDEDAAP